MKTKHLLGCISLILYGLSLRPVVAVALSTKNSDLAMLAVTRDKMRIRIGHSIAALTLNSGVEHWTF